MAAESLLAAVEPIMRVQSWMELQVPAGGVRFMGELRVLPADAIDHLHGHPSTAAYLPLLNREGAQETVTLIPAPTRGSAGRPWVAGLLLALTTLSVLFVGSTMVHSDISEVLRRPLDGWPFALALMSILGAHESAHYLMAKRFGVTVSFPYFIPMPIGPLGTMGAVINMSSVPRNRSEILRIGAAGPLAGLVVTLVVLVYGLATSPVEVIPPGLTFLREGNSLLYLALKRVILGEWLPAGSLDVNLTPVAFAGWAGLLVTGLNLIPAGQLDGGHAAFGLLGAAAQKLTLAVGIVLAAMGFIWSGWFLWAGLILLLGRRPTLVQDPLTPLTPGERRLGLLLLVLAVLLFSPVPLAISMS